MFSQHLHYKVSTLLDVLRVAHWQSLFGMVLLGSVLSIKANSFILALAYLSASLILSHIFLVNSYFDVEIDRVKEVFTGDELIVSRVISKKKTAVVSLLLLIAGIGVAVFVSLTFCVLLLLTILITTAYSVPPIRFKKTYPFSTLVHFQLRYYFF